MNTPNGGQAPRTITLQVAVPASADLNTLLTALSAAVTAAGGQIVGEPRNDATQTGYRVVYVYESDAATPEDAAIDAIRYVDEHGIDEASLRVTNLRTGAINEIDANSIELCKLYDDL